MDDAICRRALAFARTFTWVNPRIISAGPADSKIVDRFGDPNAFYGAVRIVMEWSDADKSKFAESAPEEKDVLMAFVASGMELLVVCSANDVIYHEFPGIDLD